MSNPKTASWSTQTMVVSPANRPGGRGDRRGYSRPARRDVPTAGVWCVPGWPVTTPPWYVTGNARIDVGRTDRPGSKLAPFRSRDPGASQGLGPPGGLSACGANAGECAHLRGRLPTWASPWITLYVEVGCRERGKSAIWRCRFRRWEPLREAPQERGAAVVALRSSSGDTASAAGHPRAADAAAKPSSTCGRHS